MSDLVESGIADLRAERNRLILAIKRLVSRCKKAERDRDTLRIECWELRQKWKVADEPAYLWMQKMLPTSRDIRKLLDSNAITFHAPFYPCGLYPPEG